MVTVVVVHSSKETKSSIQLEFARTVIISKMKMTIGIETGMP